jgi:ABC-2 type transport system permease protein
MSFLVVIFYPSFSTSFQFDELTKQMPSALQGLIGNVDNFKTLHGYISDQLFNIRIPLIMLIMAIVLGLGLSISDEESGRMRTILIAPISRTNVLFSKLLASVVIVGIVALATVISLYLGIFVIHESAPHVLIWQLFGLSWLFGSVAVSIVLGIGLASGERAPTTGISLLLTIGSFILATFGVAVQWLEPYTKFSLLHYYDATGLSSNTFKPIDLLVLIGVGIFITLIAVMRFSRRDIN